MNSAKIESMNVSIHRIVSKAYGLRDVPFLSTKLMQRFLINLRIYHRRLMQDLSAESQRRSK